MKELQQFAGQDGTDRLENCAQSGGDTESHGSWKGGSAQQVRPADLTSRFFDK